MKLHHAVAILAVVFLVPATACTAGPVPRFYHPDSPWNLAIGERPPVDPLSATYVAALNGPFGCNPEHYTIPLYRAGEGTARVPVRVRKYFSDVGGDSGGRLEIRKRLVVQVPIPPDAVEARGRDGNLVVWDPRTGDEWGFWQARREGTGWVVRNGYHYNTRWSGVPPAGFRSRGAGVPYLAGLVLEEEIRAGAIEHALAFGVNYPADWYVFPATKTDSRRRSPRLLPMGARLQLDPTLTEEDFDRWGLSRAGKVIARALQRYGMILVSGAGHPKIYVESSNTADWQGILDKNTVRPIPYRAFRLLSLGTPPRPEPPARVTAAVAGGEVRVQWAAVPYATRYRISRQMAGGEPEEVARGVTGSSWRDTAGITGRRRYLVRGVHHNGVGEAAASPWLEVE